MNAKTYRKRPVQIEAMRYGPTPTAAHDVTCWMEEGLYPGLMGDATRPETLRYPDQVEGDDSTPDKGWYIDPATGGLMIRTLEGDMCVSPGDYVIRGVQGEFYPCKPGIFETTYDEVNPGMNLVKNIADAAVEAAYPDLNRETRARVAVEIRAKLVKQLNAQNRTWFAVDGGDLDIAAEVDGDLNITTCKYGLKIFEGSFDLAAIAEHAAHIAEGAE